MYIDNYSISWELFKEYYATNKLKFVHYPIYDFSDKDMRNKLRPAADALHHLVENKEIVYVHCTAGVNRSPSVISMYLCIYKNMTPSIAIHYVCLHRKWASPNKAIIEEVYNLTVTKDKVNEPSKAQ